MKKRIISLTLTFSIILSMFPLNIMTAFAQESAVMYGDADGNGRVELKDVQFMEKYIDGDEDPAFNFEQADVNADGAVDDIDVSMVKDYLVGNLESLTPVLCELSFETNGGGEIEPITVGKGYGTHKDIPSPAKDGYIFTGWVDEEGNNFYPLAPITDNMVLTAVYEPVESNEQIHIDSFALTDQEEDLTFSLDGDFASADDVKENLTLLAKDGWESVELEVTGSGGKWTVKAKNGFRPGGSEEPRIYTTVYGKPFLELSSLSGTGADNPAEGKYSAFQKLTYTDGGEQEIFPLDTPVNLSYIEQFGANGRVYANYSDDSRTATFTFRGVNVPDKTVTFRSGETPAPGDLQAYVQKACGEDAAVESVTPAITPSESSMQYVVTCSIDPEHPIYQLSYNVSVPDGYPGGQIAMSPSRYFADSVIFEPNLYLTFWSGMTDRPQLSPWYYDEAMTQPVNFSTARMPEKDITIYAKVLTRSIKVHFIVQGEEISSKDISEGSMLQDLPEVTLSGGQKFLGWYASPDGTGEEYTYYSTISTSENDFYLYAKVGQKEEVAGLNAAYFEKFKVNEDYNRSLHHFSFELGQEYLDKGIRPEDFIIQWRPNGAATTA